MRTIASQTVRSFKTFSNRLDERKATQTMKLKPTSNMSAFNKHSTVYWVFRPYSLLLVVLLIQVGLLTETTMLVLADNEPNVDPSCVTFCRSNPMPGYGCPAIFDPILCDIDGCREVYSSGCAIGDRFQDVGRNITCTRCEELVDDMNECWEMTLWPECPRISETDGSEDCKTNGSYHCPAGNSSNITYPFQDSSSSLDGEDDGTKDLTQNPTTPPSYGDQSPKTKSLQEGDEDGMSSGEIGILIMIIVVAIAAGILAVWVYRRSRKTNLSVSNHDDEQIVKTHSKQDVNEMPQSSDDPC